MKKILAILAILLTFGAVASAQIPSSPVSLYVGGALSIPTAPESFTTSFKNGYHGSLGLGFDVNPAFELIGKVEYHTFNFDFDQAAAEMSGYLVSRLSQIRDALVTSQSAGCVSSTLRSG